MSTVLAAGGERPNPPVLRVCHLAYTFFENDNRVLRYAETLRDKGHHVDVIALRRPGQARAGLFRGIRVRRIQRRSVTEERPWLYVAKLAWFLTHATLLLAALTVRRRYDVVHVHNLPDFLVFAAVVPKLFGTRVILDIHDVLPELYASKFGAHNHSRASRLMLATERFSCNFAHHVIVANDIWRAKLAQRAVTDERCTTILNYPDLRLFTASPPRRQPNRTFRVLYPGSLNPHQGVDVLLKAFKSLSANFTDVELHIYGEGAALRELVALSHQLRITNLITFWAPVPIDQMPAVMASADVGVEPKLGVGFSNEALGTRIFEFMACRVPVIASRTAAHAQYFDDAMLRFFPPGDPAALANALAAEYAGWRRQDDLNGHAFDFAMRYSWQEHNVEYHRLIDGLLHAGRSALRDGARSHY